MGHKCMLFYKHSQDKVVFTMFIYSLRLQPGSAQALLNSPFSTCVYYQQLILAFPWDLNDEEVV